MRKLDAATFRSMPWKNGGGTTVEVLTLPPGATLDTFEVRVSQARVESSGPFSRFPGIDRTLLVTKGRGLTLAMADDALVSLGPESRPFAFTGGDTCVAALTDGPVEDLNVMTRRGVCTHQAVRFSLSVEQSLTCSGMLSLLAILAGKAVAADENDELTLAPGDLLTVSPGDPLVVVRPDGGPLDVLLVDFFRVEGGRR